MTLTRDVDVAQEIAPSICTNVEHFWESPFTSTPPWLLQPTVISVFADRYLDLGETRFLVALSRNSVRKHGRVRLWFAYAKSPVFRCIELCDYMNWLLCYVDLTHSSDDPFFHYWMSIAISGDSTYNTYHRERVPNCLSRLRWNKVQHAPWYAKLHHLVAWPGQRVGMIWSCLCGILASRLVLAGWSQSSGSMYFSVNAAGFF